MDLYEYRPLSSNTSFRVLRLAPGEGEDIPSCSLVEVFLNEPPSYEALSYVWGKVSRTESVSCEGKRLLVTESLNKALRALRNPAFPRFLWADGLCINQDDLQERAQQVSVMREIYEKARRGILWLGEESDAIAKAYTFIDKVTLKLCEYLDELEDVYDRDVCHQILQKAAAEFDIQARQVLQILFDNAWFHRAWVFQEVVCASQPVIQCGQNQIDFSIFSLFAVIVYANGLIPFLSSGQSRSALHRLTMMDTVKRRYERGHREPLFQLLLATRGSLAHDKRDFLFSFAGIATGDRPLPYHADYVKSWENWYTDFAEHVIRSDIGLEILSQCHFRNDRDTNIPSWVPDWSSSATIPFQMNHPSRIFNAGGLNKAIQETSVVGGKLLVSGYIFDKICSLGNAEVPSCVSNLDDSSDEDWETKSLVFCEIVQECIEIVKTSRLYQSSPDLIWQALWRTLVGEQSHGIQNNEPVQPAFENGITYLRPLIFSNISSIDIEVIRLRSALRSDVYRAMQRTMFHRRFALTESGHIGWVPETAEVEDNVAVFLGLGMPVTLRPCGSADHLNVGECFVHGIMDGEVLQVPSLDIRQIQLV